MPVKRRLRARAPRLKRPLGINVLLAYLGVLLAFYIIYFILSLPNPLVIVLGRFVLDNAALLILIGLAAGTALLLYGVAKRAGWAFWLSLVWFAAGIVNAAVNLAALASEVLGLVSWLTALSSISVIVINGLIIWYLGIKRAYFFAPASRAAAATGRPDRIFSYGIIAFVVIVLGLSLGLGIGFYRSNITMADSLISELGTAANSEQEIALCNGKEAIERDLCFLITAIKQDSKSLCDHITSSFYRASCLRA